MRVMILAAGRGERMRPLTDRLPKPLLEAGGKTLIGWHLERLAAAGFREVVVNNAWLGHEIERALGDGSRWGLSVRHSPETVALETAGGIVQALPLLGDAPFLVVNGDVYTDWDFGRAPDIAAQMQAADLDAWLVLADNPPQHPKGDFAIVHGRLANDGPVRYTFSGIAVYQPRMFAGLRAGERAPLAPLLRRCADQGRAGAERLPGAWFDVGTPQRLADLDAQLRARSGNDAAL